MGCHFYISIHMWCWCDVSVRVFIGVRDHTAHLISDMDYLIHNINPIIYFSLQFLFTVLSVNLPQVDADLFVSFCFLDSLCVCPLGPAVPGLYCLRSPHGRSAPSDQSLLPGATSWISSAAALEFVYHVSGTHEKLSS